MQIQPMTMDLTRSPTEATKALVKKERPDWWAFTIYKMVATGRIYARCAMPPSGTDLDVTETQGIS